jgi:hypothetical protein
MDVGGQITVGFGEAQAFIPDPRRHEGDDDDMASPLEGWEPSSPKQYYIDVDDVLDEVTAVRRYEDDDDMTRPLEGCEPTGAKQYYIDSNDVLDELTATN